jgi:hypothetical protein
MSRPRPLYSRSDRGQASLAYIGALLAAAMVVSAATVAVGKNQEPITRAAHCAVDKVITLLQSSCADGVEAGPGAPDPSAPGGPLDEGPGGERPKSCADVIYVNSTRSGTTHSNPSEFSRQVRVNCVWYPVNPDCVPLAAVPYWEPEMTVPAQEREAMQKLADCVTAGVGPPGKNPDDIACNKTTIMTGKVTKDPPLAQFGCTEWVVPIQCKDQWEAWQELATDASPGDRYQAGVGLQSCIENFYSQNETVCFVKQDKVTEKWEITMLFFLKVEGSNGVLVEQLGDGRWRVHALDESKIGGDFKGPKDLHSAEFGLLAMSGWSGDKTFEFGDQAAAEKWVEWYKDYSATLGRIKSANRTNCPHAYCVGDPSANGHLRDLVKSEPKRKKISEADGRSTTVNVRGGYNPNGGGGVGINGGWKGEASTENRYSEDGTKSSTLTMSNEGAVNLLAKLSRSKKKPGEKPGDPKVDGDLGGTLNESIGTSAKGKVSLTAAYNKDGSLAKVIVTMDDSFLNTLSKVNPELSVKLPGGFTVEPTFTYQVDKGQSTIREIVVDMATHEDRRAELEDVMKEIFPQDDKGKFSGEAPSLSFNTGGIGDLVDDVGTTRNLKYDTSVEEISGSLGVYFAQMPLINVKGGKITEGRNLTGSSLDVTDVNNNTTKMTPSPKCRDKQVNPETYGYDKGPPFADRAL